MEGAEWKYLDKSYGDCTHCRTLCQRESGCTGYECGLDSCMGWLGGACGSSTTDAGILSSAVFTCRMEGEMKSASTGWRRKCEGYVWTRCVVG